MWTREPERAIPYEPGLYPARLSARMPLSRCEGEKAEGDRTADPSLRERAVVHPCTRLYPFASPPPNITWGDGDRGRSGHFRPAERARDPAGVSRLARRGAGCTHHRGGGGHREDDAMAIRRRSTATPRSVSSSRAQPRWRQNSRTRPSSIFSRTSSLLSSLLFPALNGTRSTWPFSSRRQRGHRPINGPWHSHSSPRFARSRGKVHSSSRSTMSSGWMSHRPTSFVSRPGVSTTCLSVFSSRAGAPRRMRLSGSTEHCPTIA